MTSKYNVQVSTSHISILCSGFFFVHMNFAYLVLSGVCIVLMHCGLLANAVQKVLDELDAPFQFLTPLALCTPSTGSKGTVSSASTNI